MEYKGNSLDSTGNGNYSFIKSPTSQYNGGNMDSVCELGEMMGMASEGHASPLPGMKGYNDEILRQYIEDYAEALLALMRGDYVCGVKGSVNHVDNVQASMATSPTRQDNSPLRFLPSNYTMDSFSCDEFRMYDFKVRRCMRGRSHDWTECPFAHPGEKARRRDPRRFHYSGTACPDFRRGACKRGDACELAHGVFECWLHPSRYRTQLCKDGKSCKRRVCFFAHSPSQLRLVSPQPAPSQVGPFPLSFSDINACKPQQFVVSPSKLTPSDSYFTEGLLEDFSPKSMHSFPDDRLSGALSPITNHSFILNDAHKHANNGMLESSSPRSSYGKGFSEECKYDKSELNNIHGDSHDYLLPLDHGNFMCQNSPDSSSHTLPMYGIPIDGLCDNLSSKNNQAHVNLRTQLALASLSSRFEQIMSPTSTLARHAFSPPLSPSDSPPMSPSIDLPNCSGISRKMASLCGQASSHDAMSAVTGAHLCKNNGNSASTAPLLVHSSGTAMFANARGPSPLSTSSVGDHPHSVHMLNAMHKLKEQRVETTFQKSQQSTQAMAHLLSSYQQIADTQGLAQPLNRIPESRQEASQRSQRANWESPLHRAESGQGMRAQIYGKLAHEEVPEAENPDLGWVNDLVT